jgi:hypothetical protein
MSGPSIGDVVGQFRRLLDVIDEAALHAKHSQSEAEQAHSGYARTSAGTSDRLMRQAVVASRTAAEKAGKTARLLSGAAAHFTTYVNIIAPGAIPTGASSPAAVPSGDQVVRETLNRQDRMSSFMRKSADKIDDLKDSTKATAKAAEQGTKIVLQVIKRDPPSAAAKPTSPSTSAAPSTATARSTVDHSVTVPDAVSAVTVTLIGAALVGRATTNYVKSKWKSRRSDANEE